MKYLITTLLLILITNSIYAQQDQPKATEATEAKNTVVLSVPMVGKLTIKDCDKQTEQRLHHYTKEAQRSEETIAANTKLPNTTAKRKRSSINTNTQASQDCQHK